MIEVFEFHHTEIVVKPLRWNVVHLKSVVCVYFLKSHSVLCYALSQADSGGPLVSLQDGVWWLIGDTIWGEHCTEKNKPGVYGNITYFLDWIYHQMRVKTKEKFKLVKGDFRVCMYMLLRIYVLLLASQNKPGSNFYLGLVI